MKGFAPGGFVYIVGKDTWRLLWSGYYAPAGGFQNWEFGEWGSRIAGGTAVGRYKELEWRRGRKTKFR